MSKPAILILSLVLSFLGAPHAPAAVSPATCAGSATGRRTALYFPLLDLDSGAGSGVRIVLRPRWGVARASARIFDESGNAVSELADFELDSTLVVPIYVEFAALAVVESDRAIDGYALYTSAGGIAEAVPAAASTSRNLDFIDPGRGPAVFGPAKDEAQPADRGDWTRTTTLVIANPGETAATVEVRGMPAGARAGLTTHSYTVPAHGSVVIRLAETIGTRKSGSIESVRIAASVPLAGVQMTDLDGRELAGLAAPGYSSGPVAISLSR
ncbi:MAG: hypothetical protein IT175_18860 [Acidobacteria bacterium]|nr:hypothetical protein [Acidobacteriota bacterium]